MGDTSVVGPVVVLRGAFDGVLQIQSFPEGRGTLFTCVPILVYIYKEFVLYMTTYAVCLLYREILCLECQPNIYFTV